MEMLLIQQRQIPFELRRSRRARRLTLKIDPHQSKVIMVVPPGVVRFEITRFLKKNENWIHDHWLKLESSLAKKPQLEHSEAYYKAKAKVLIRERLRFFNEYYQLDYRRVSFRDQKTRWGSCSTEKNLNFNWRLVLAPLEVLDYVVVHELCHLKHMNHSQDFWRLVAEQAPDYRKRRQWLKENHFMLSIP